ncbi:MAG: sigma-70 family RNA polymerase sigma factor [Spartobacteria bacterium]|nr:sigma-70 family RNA polymerase sigma factor [Spartobacteria bacterium]
MTEKEDNLVEAARKGDEHAFGELVSMYNDRLYAVVYGFVHHVDDARDICQQVWVKAWRKLHTFKGDAKFFTWLYRIASFSCMDFARRQARSQETPLLEEIEPARDVDSMVPPSVGARPDQKLQQAEIREAFNRALDVLSPEHRMALVLREVDGLSYEEIAQAMKCRKGTVMSRLFHARKHIQEQMSELRGSA